MKYENIVKGNFIERPNRFIAQVTIADKVYKAHVKNTGRCRELLIKGVPVYLQDHNNNMHSRKLRYSLVSVKKGDKIVNIDSQAPNKVVKEALESGKISLEGMGKILQIKAEKTYGSSRLDFFVKDDKGHEGYIEVKGVTLEENGIAMFPDAPTERGVKHIKELINAVENGKKGFIVFIIQMKGVRAFTPNRKTHEEFAQVLKAADKKGVKIMAYDCTITEEEILCGDAVHIML